MADPSDVQVLLDGLAVGSLSELRQLVEAARGKSPCPDCDWTLYMGGCVNYRCDLFDAGAHEHMVRDRLR